MSEENLTLEMFDAQGWQARSGIDNKAHYVYHVSPKGPVPEMFSFAWDGDPDHPVEVSVGGAYEPVKYCFAAVLENLYEAMDEKLAKEGREIAPLVYSIAFEALCDQWYAQIVMPHYGADEDVRFLKAIQGQKDEDIQ